MRQKEIRVLKYISGPKEKTTILMKVFAMMGLPLTKKQCRTNLVSSLLQLILVLYMNGILMLYLVRILQFMILTKQFMKSAFSLLVSVFISIFLWTMTFWSRKDIRSLVSAMFKLRVGKSHWVTEYLIPALAVSSFLTPLATFAIFIRRENLHLLNLVITFGPSIAKALDDLGLTSVVFYTFTLSVHCFLNLMPNCLTLLCSWMFMEMRNVLAECEVTIQQQTDNSRSSDHLFRLYNSVFRFKSSMECVMGKTVLLLVVSGFLTVFTSLSGLLGDDDGSFTSPEMIENSLSHMLVRIVFLLCLLFTSAEVNERDKAFRRAVVLHTMGSRNKGLQPLFLAEVDGNTTALSFSVCGYFTMTREFVASAIGILLTYTVLFIQLQKKATN